MREFQRIKPIVQYTRTHIRASASASTAMKMVASSRLLIRFINDMVGARTTNWFITLNCLTTLLVAISYVCAGRAMHGHVDLLRECMC